MYLLMFNVICCLESHNEKSMKKKKELTPKKLKKKLDKIRKKHDIPVSDFVQTLNEYINDLDPQGYYG